MNILISTVAVLLAAYLIPDIHVDSLLTGIIVAITLGVINTFVRPILRILTLPITCLTLGLFLLVINAVLVLLVAWLVPGFSVDGFLAALLFSIVVSFVNAFLSAFTD